MTEPKFGTCDNCHFPENGLVRTIWGWLCPDCVVLLKARLTATADKGK